MEVSPFFKSDVRRIWYIHVHVYVRCDFLRVSKKGMSIVLTINSQSTRIMTLIEQNTSIFPVINILNTGISLNNYCEFFNNLKLVQIDMYYN